MVVPPTRGRCQHSGCRRDAEFGPEFDRPAFCSDHKDQYMERDRARCQHPGCTRQPSYGWPSSQPVVCFSHHEPGMVHGRSGPRERPGRSAMIMGRLGLERGALSQSWADEDSERPPRSGVQRRFSMSDIEARRAATQATAGVTKPSRCTFPGCHKNSVFAFEGEDARFCRDHRVEGMESVLSARCASAGCKMAPNYGYPGGGGVCCFSHRQEGMRHLVGQDRLPRQAAPAAGNLRMEAGQT